MRHPTMGAVRRRVAGAATAFALLHACGAALAQSETEGPSSCARIESQSERLACYDRYLRGDEPSEGSGAETAPDDAPAAPSNTVRDEPPEGRPADSSAQRAAPVVDLGRPRDGPQPAEPPTERTVLVVEVQARGPLPVVFTLQSGETWVQIDGGSTYHLGTPPFSARITRSGLGGHFLTPENGGRRIRVRRVD